MKLLKKIGSLLGSKKTKGRRGSAFAEKLKQQPSYRASQLGAEPGKKTFLEKLKWRVRKRQQQKSISSAQRGEGRAWKSPLLRSLLLAVSLSAGYLVLVGPLHRLLEEYRYFQIQEIAISGCRVTTPAVLKKFAGINYQLNMLTLDPEVIQQRLQSHPWISQAKIRRIWPDGLAVSVQEYRPEAIIVQGEGKSFYYLDKDGEIFAPVGLGQELDYPVVTGLDGVGNSEEKGRMLAEVLSFLSLAQRNNPNLPAQNVSEIHLTGDGELILYLVKHPFPIYFGKGNVKRKYYQLRKVLEVLYQKRKGGPLIEKVAYIRMDYQENKVLVARNSTG